MNILYYSLSVLILLLPRQVKCIKNNVCEALQDYYTIKKNKNCSYDVAADPDSDPTTIIEYYGYPSETHKVVTLDGYILTIFRIPNNEVTSNMPKGPVFLQHGLMGSAGMFLGLGKDSLAFLLADAGYDVWLGNYRGTEYSEEHVNLTVYDTKYWDYSADEIGQYDIPAQLDYISKTTGNRGNIIYIGYSLGTSAGLIYSSTYPEHARKTLKLLILLAPAAHLPNTRAPIFKYLGPIYKPLLKILVEKNLIRFVSHAKILKLLFRNFCFKSSYHLQQCGEALNILFAGPHSQVDPKRLPVAFNISPAGSSFKILAHAADVSMGHFARYDYGPLNSKIYGSSEPPPYELREIQVPVFLAFAMNDWGADAEDAHILYNNLSPNVRYGKYEIRAPNFNHIDFIHGRNAKSILYDIILQVVDMQLPLQANCIENNVCETLQDYFTIQNNKNCAYDVAADPDSNPTTIIEYYGYPSETHKVTTLDGYILTMFRIPNNKVTSNMPKGPVFLQHGLMGSAGIYLGLGKDSLAFLLADAGYDVWLGNYRGTEYSEEHVNLTVYDTKYWDYSADEIGQYDIPAQLDYISKTTGNNGNIIYIGYSLGTTTGLIYSSTYPEQAKKTLKLLILLAPAAHLPNTRSPIFTYLGPIYKPLLKRLPVAFNIEPAGSSFKILAHASDYFMGRFTRYDYGPLNAKIYGSSQPPPYELGKIQVPVFLAFAIKDWAADPEDAHILYNNLSPSVRYGKYEIRVPNFNHVDFIHGRSVKSILYDKILQVLDSFE